MAANPNLEDKIHQLIQENNELDIDSIKSYTNKLINTLENLRPSIRTEFKRLILDQSQAHLNFHNQNLTTEELKDIADLLTLTKVTSIDLSNNNLGNLNFDSLIDMLEALPKTMTSLNLWGCNLIDLNYYGLIEMLEALPETVASLNLGANNLCDLDYPYKLGNVLKSLPETVTSLNLEKNDLYFIYDVDLALRELPKTVTNLSLNGNIIANNLSRSVVVDLLKVLLENVTSLNLNDNYLCRCLGSDDFKEVLKPLTGRYVELFLEHNDLSDELMNEIQEIMRFGKKTTPAKRKEMAVESKESESIKTTEESQRDLTGVAETAFFKPKQSTEKRLSLPLGQNSTNDSQKGGGFEDSDDEHSTPTFGN